MNNFQKGLLAEYLTICLYKIRFYRILHHRYKNYLGEIDLIAKRGQSLIFIEVKARKDNLSETIISQKQKQRIKNSASYFLAQNEKYIKYDVRFDLVFIRYLQWPMIIQNAW